MSDISFEVKGLKADYESRVAEDLRRIAQARKQVAEQIAALQEQLRVMDSDCEMLLSMQQAVTGVQGQTRPEAKVVFDDTASIAIPGPVSPAPGEAPTVPASGLPSQAAESEVRGDEGGLKNAKITQVVERCLRENKTLMSAAEVADKVSATGRPISIISVRTALEGLVRRSVVYRSKQGRSVYYGHARAASAAPESQEWSEPDPS